MSESTAGESRGTAMPHRRTTRDSSAAVGRAREIQASVEAIPDARTAQLRALRRRLSRDLRTAPSDHVVALADELIGTGVFALRFIAYELIAYHEAAHRQLTERWVVRLGRGISSWSDVDTFAIYIAGPAWRNRRIDDRLVRSWAACEDRWWRRAALVSTVPLNLRSRGGTGDVARTLDICERLVDDRDDMVVKALSWALRELAKHEPDAVAAFVRERGPGLAPRVLREVRNKLRTGRKDGSRSARRS